jgi:hypothetical protein
MLMVCLTMVVHTWGQVKSDDCAGAAITIGTFIAQSHGAMGLNPMLMMVASASELCWRIN